MPTYTVHKPPLRKDESTSGPERFVFVRDGFYFWAFSLAPLWLLVHQLWLALVGYLIVNVAFGAALMLTDAPAWVEFFAGFVVALMLGLEAATLWRWTLTRRGWKMLGFVIGENSEMAERRFYAEWVKRTDQAGVLPVAPEPRYATPIWRGVPSPSDVIGLFPEPGARR